MAKAPTKKSSGPRGRPKGSKNKPKDAAAPRAGQVTEHDKVHIEDLTDDQEQVLFFQHHRAYSKALEAKKSADAEFKNVAKKAKSDLGATGVEQIKLHIALESDEGKRALQERMRWQAKIARWQGMAIGHQDDLFGEDRTPIEDKIYADGKTAGLAGADNAPPSHLDGVLKSRWQAGYNDGQAVLLAGFKQAKVGEAFGAPPAEPTAAAEPAEGIHWRARGAQAFVEGRNDLVPDDVPEGKADEFLEGYTKAKNAHEKRMSVTDFRAQGRLHRKNGGGGSIPDAVPADKREEWLAGWGEAADAIDKRPAVG